MAPHLPRRAVLLVNLSGRGDKDVESVLRYQAEHPAEGVEEAPAELETHPAARKWSGPPKATTGGAG
jgi:hypothetical protein